MPPKCSAVLPLTRKDFRREPIFSKHSPAPRNCNLASNRLPRNTASVFLLRTRQLSQSTACTSFQGNLFTCFEYCPESITSQLSPLRRIMMTMFQLFRTIFHLDYIDVEDSEATTQSLPQLDRVRGIQFHSSHIIISITKSQAHSL